jgi:hypothetical protein
MIVYDTKFNTLTLHSPRYETPKIASQGDGEDEGRGLLVCVSFWLRG